MKVKKFFKLAAGMILAVSFSNSFAMNPECPSTDSIRNAGSKFLYAYNISKDDKNSWALLSEPFRLDEVNWQTIYTVELPWSVDNPNDAIRVGEAMFNKSPLLTNGASTTTAGKTECLYTTADVNYKVTAVSPPPFGLRKS